LRYNHLKLVLLMLLSGGFSVNSCSQQPVKKIVPTDSLVKNWNQTIPGNFSEQTKTVFDSTQLTVFINHFPGFKSFAIEINSFYRKRNFAYAWFDKGLLIEQAGNLSNRILNLNNEGIYKAPPYQNVLDSLIFNLNANKKQPDLTLELMLTSQYFVFSKLAWQGMNDEVSKSASWFVPRKKVNYNQYLDSLLKMPTKFTAANEPVYRQYELLKNYLRKYRKLDSLEKWLPIVIKNKSFKSGDSSVTITLIKKRLYQLEDFHGNTLNNVSNSELATAVKHFQQRHGLEINGLLNNSTLVELNVPLKSRIKQILVNMERSRWLPVSLKDDYLAVNIPEFKLHVYHADSLLWSCDVVVGQAVHQTTIFYGEVKYVVFSPYWNIPPGILRNEIIPGMKRNSNYIAAHNMEITGYSNGLPIVRQKPGSENSLGLVKFLFPNSYNIYLHDTPSKSLFGESSRAFSHGCIRVKEPAKLANFLLQNSTNWNADKITRAMHSGKEQYVTLKDKVPVFIAYFTAFTDRNNTLNFRKDIYNRDEQLGSMIISGKGEY
jgi:murein L,D-transpeptidase YcbB/YkuD